MRRDASPLSAASDGRSCRCCAHSCLRISPVCQRETPKLPPRCQRACFARSAQRQSSAAAIQQGTIVARIPAASEAAEQEDDVHSRRATTPRKRAPPVIICRFVLLSW